MDLPTIENVVSTAMLLPRGKGQYRLPLDALSRQLKCSQYAPVQFAANIIKISDSITDSTVLIFASGKIVVVASLTLEHTRYVSQLVRHIVEQVNCMVRDADGQVYESNLIGRTVFQECKIHNIVGSGNLNCRIDLQAMCDAAPLACKWFPDWFPGLKCKVWLTESHSCECAFGCTPASGGGAAKEGGEAPSPPPAAGGTGEDEDILPLILGKQKKCTCAVKLLVFDSGRIVITGARSIENVNNVYFRIKRLIVNFTKNGPNTVERAKVKDELKTLLVKPLTPAPAPQAPAAGAAGAGGAKEPRRKKVKVAPPPPSAASGGGGGSLPPLLKFALAGRINDIRTLLQMDKDLAAIKLTLQRLQDFMSKAPNNRKSLVTSKKSAIQKQHNSKKGNVIREPRVIARESFDKHTKGRQDAEQKLLAALHAEHVKQNLKPLYSAYFMKVTNRLQKIVRECCKSNSVYIAAHATDGDMLFRLTLTHGQKETLQTLQLFGILDDESGRLNVFLDEAQGVQLQSEQGMNRLVAFANSASHAAENSEADLSSRQQIALHQHFLVMLGQDLYDRVVFVKQQFPEVALVDAKTVKELVMESLK